MYTRSKHIADFNIAGVRYWDGALVVGSLKPGKRLHLEAEPDNPHDEDAVAIYCKEAKLGYVPRDQNRLISQLLYFGHGEAVECRVLKVDKRSEPWEQIRVGLYMVDRAGGSPGHRYGLE